MTDTQDTDALMARIEELEAQLQQEHHENATLRRLLFTQYAKQPRVMRPLNLPIPDRAIILFEVLPEAFDLEEAIVAAEKLGLEEIEAAEHIRTYFQEGMLADDEDGTKPFVKTGHRPYL